MKREFISKIIAGTVILTTICTLVPVRASAEWVNDYQGNWYFMQDDEKMTGWKNIDGNIYYFNENGKMLTGWIKGGSSWYFLQNNGVLKTGWINYNKKWYYADSSGAIQAGTLNINGKIYIFDDNGAMKTSNTVINGEFYTIGTNGAVVGAKVPTPDKEFDGDGNCIEVITSNNTAVTKTPTDSKFNEVIKDQSVSNEDPNEGRIFKVNFKDSNGKELKTKSVKYEKSVELFEPTKDGYIFKEWNTRSDGSGKSYESDDDIKVKEDINLYAQWTEDTDVYVDGIAIKGNAYVTVNKTTQMTAEVTPSDASDKGVKWSVDNGTGKATIDSNGVLTGVSAGTVKVKATAKDGSKVSTTKEITVSAADVVVPIQKITVTSESGSYKISRNAGTLQMEAAISPEDATNQDIAWTVESEGGGANIDPKTGLLTAISNGSVKVVATASNGVVGSRSIEISGQSVTVPVSAISIAGKAGATKILTDAALGGTNGTLQMVVNVLPITAANKSVTWSVESGTGKAVISSGGLLTAQADGDVKVKAVSKENPAITAETTITIENQTIKLTGFNVQGKNGSTSIDTDGGNLQMVVMDKTPTGASYKTFKWSVERISGNGGSAEISDSGILKAITNGKVTVKATATNIDGSQVTNSTEISISGQNKEIDLTGIEVIGIDGATSIRTNNGTLQMVANLLPYNQTVTTSSAVTWSVTNGTGTAKIDPTTGVLTALSNGTVKVKAKAPSKDGTLIVSKEAVITIYGQYIEITGIDVKPEGSKVEVGGTLHMTAVISPDNATYKTVKWEIEAKDGGATIGQESGILTGTSAGEVIARAIDIKSGTVSGEEVVTVIDPIKVTGITLSGTDTITTTGGAVVITAGFDNTPTNKGLAWTVEPYGGTSGTEQKGSASFVDNGDGTAKVTALTNGWVLVKATAKDGSGKVGTYPIKISGQIVKVTGITVTAAGNAATMQVIGGTLQMSATVAPYNADEQGVTWSVDKPEIATITPDGGLLTAVSAGTVTVKATTKEGNSTIFGTKAITINPISSITITGGDTVQTGKILKLAASILPSNVTNKNVTWTVVNYDVTEPNHGWIDVDTGKLTGLSAGKVLVTATSTDGSGKSKTTLIIIT